MNKLLNDPQTIETDMIDGVIKSAPHLVRRISAKSNVLVRLKKKPKYKVALVSGGGSGHEPLHTGYVGFGMLDAAVPGKIFTSPPATDIQAAIEEVATEAGVLCIVKNYSGDIMNFEIAIEECQSKGIKVDYVVVNDDVAVENSLYTTGRRGVAGTSLVHKIAGACAEQDGTLKEVKKVAQRVIDNVRSMGVALSPCVLPSTGLKSFDLGEDEMEIGIGIHGEPGIRREKIMPTQKIVELLMEKILADLDYKKHEVVVMVNGLGGTAQMELLLATKYVHEILDKNDIRVFDTLAGNFTTSLEMEGFSITLLRLDDDMKSLYNFPARTLAFQKYPEKI